jgi:hypothetical protein
VARINNLLSNPDDLQSQQKKAQHDGDTERHLLQMLPDAFLYHDAGQKGVLMKTIAQNALQEYRAIWRVK